MAFRILSLDGGGTWSLIQIRVLQRLYGPDATGHEVLGNFRLAVANSGGSLVLGGLLANMRLSELLKLYLDKSARQAIFHHLSVYAHPIDRGVHALWHVYPQFSTKAKLKALQHFLGAAGAKSLEAIAKDVPGCPHILIPAFDYDLQRATFFRSDINSVANASRGGPAPTLAEAIHASSTAPVNFFDHPARLRASIDLSHRRFWDGAIGGYNNPVLAAAIEALANATRYECDAASIRALSIGTARTALPLRGPYATQSPLLVEQPQTSRPLNDIKLLATAIVDDPPDAASFAAHVMLGGRVTGDSATPVTDGPIVRLNPLIQPKLAGNEWQLPDKTVPAVGKTLDIASFHALAKMDMAAVEDDQVRLIGLLCDAWMDGNALNQPIQSGGKLQPLIGHRYYDEGVATWMQS